MLIFLAILWLVLFTILVFYFLGLYRIIRYMCAFAIEMRSGSPHEVVALDEASLEEMTRELESLGFEKIGDIVGYSSSLATQIAAPISDPLAKPPPPTTRIQHQILSRVTLHPQHGCLGIAHSMVVSDIKGKLAPKAKSWLSFYSFSEMSGKKWSYSTTNYQPPTAQDKIMRLCQRPHTLWTRMSNATPQQMLQKHLERRQQITSEASLEWLPRPKENDYIKNEQDWTSNARAIFGQLTVLKLWQRLRVVERERKNPEWLGELKGRLK